MQILLGQEEEIELTARKDENDPLARKLDTHKDMAVDSMITHVEGNKNRRQENEIGQCNVALCKQEMLLPNSHQLIFQ